MFFKVIFHLDGAGVYYDPHEPIHLDALLAWVLAPKQGAPLDITRDDRPQEIKLPLIKCHINGSSVWRASALFPDDQPGETIEFYRRRFRQGKAEISKGALNLTNGIYRDWNMPLPLLLTRRMVAYAKGNRKEVKRILREIRYLGKKRSYGYGKILFIEYPEMDDDFSLSKDGRAMRYLPDKNGSRFVRCIPPYWNNVDRVNCLNIGDPTDIK